MQSGIVAFSGGVESGKTTISRMVAQTLNWPWASFGDLIRREAQERGQDAPSRQLLEDLGQALVDSDVEGFVNKFLRMSGWQASGQLIVDGLRHVEVLQSLRQTVAPVPVIVVVIEADINLRRSRLARSGRDEDLTAIDTHPAECQTFTKLPKYAEFTIDATKELEISVHDVAAWIDRRLAVNAC